MWDDNIYGDPSAAAQAASITSTGGGWETWVQRQASGLLGAAANVWQQQQLANVQRGPDGGYYVEGQARYRNGQPVGMDGGTLLLIGGALVLFMLMKD